MKLAVHTASLSDLPFEEGLATLQRLGIGSVELGVAGYFADDLRYGDPDELLGSETALRHWRDQYRRHGIEINALAAHGEPLSPDESLRREYERQFLQTCALAERIGVSRITALAGLPEGAPGDRSPAWIVSWPSEFRPPDPAALDWQWEERVIPYWQEHARIASEHGCRLCFEPRAWDVVYNPRTLLKLRAAVGPTVGAALDPSHLIPQGIDSCEAVRALGDAIYAVQIKDTRLHQDVVRVNGLLDVNPTQRMSERAWAFAAPGYGSEEYFWRRFVAALRLAGYDEELTIEYEDFYMSPKEGVRKAVELMQPIVIEHGPAHDLSERGGDAK